MSSRNGFLAGVAATVLGDAGFPPSDRCASSHRSADVEGLRGGGSADEGEAGESFGDMGAVDGSVGIGSADSLRAGSALADGLCVGAASVMAGWRGGAALGRAVPAEALGDDDGLLRDRGPDGRESTAWSISDTRPATDDAGVVGKAGAPLSGGVAASARDWSETLCRKAPPMF